MKNTILKNSEIILASGSPRRADLLTQAGFSFRVEKSLAEEYSTALSPAEYAKDLALLKSSDIFEKNSNDSIIVIGSDTIVYYDGEILGKPADASEAFDMLNMLAGRTHQVYTGVAILARIDGTTRTSVFAECTNVTFYPVSDWELKEYIATGDPLDKAGSYGIQGPFAIHVKEIQGDYNNVVGLPLARLYQELKVL